MYPHGVNRIQTRKGVYETHVNTLLCFGILYNRTYKEEEENFQYQVKKIKYGRAGDVETSFTVIFFSLRALHCVCVSEFICSRCALHYVKTRNDVSSKFTQ
jgi:hypothetical protein